jgi:hypothetical protein
LVIPRLEINSVEVLGPIKLIQQIVNAHFQLAILFIHKQNRCPIWRLVLSNIPPTKEVINYFLNSF